MRIDRLDLIAFGPFRGQSLDFSKGQHGLHVVLGANEAGKSSALRAVQQLFYGIPHRSTDNFLSDFSNLRIGATLRHGEETIEVVRRKAVKKSLFLGPDDTQDIEESTLASRFLGNTTAETFGRMFTLDHITLSEGGRAMLNIGGEFAQILFGASLDLPRLRSCQKDLESQMEELFVPKGKRKINLLLSDLETARHQVLASAIKGPDWSEQTALLEDLHKSARRIDDERGELDRQRQRMDRISRAIPDLAVRESLKVELASLSDVPDLGEDFPDRRREYETSLRDASVALAMAVADVEALTQRLESLPPRASLLDDADAIDALQLELGKEQSSVKHREQAIRERDEALAAARASLVELGRSEDDPETANVVVLTAHDKAHLRTLASDRQAILLDLKGARKAIEANGRAIDISEARIAALPTARSAVDLTRVLATIEARGDLSASVENLAGEIKRGQREVRAIHAKLGAPDVEPHELAVRPVPSLEVIARYKTLLEDRGHEVDRLGQEVARIEDDITECKARIERRRGESVVPSEDDLREARRRRDRGWGFIKRSWRDGEPDSAEAAGFCDEAHAANLGEAFEGAVSRADLVADGLRRDAARVAQEIQDLVSLRKDEELLERARSRQETALRRREETSREWAETWVGSGISPRSPQEMATWCNDHARLVDRVQSLEEKSEQIKTWRSQIAEDVHAIERELAALGETATSDGTLAAARARGVEAVERLRGQEHERKELRKGLLKSEDLKKQAESDHEDAARRLTEWEATWARAIQPLGVASDATIEQVSAILDEVEKFSAAQTQVRKQVRIIRDTDEASRAFRSRLQELAPRHAPSLADREAAVIVAGLARKLREAQDVETDREQTSRMVREKHEARQAILSRMAGFQKALDGLCAEAGCQTIPELAEVQGRWEARRQAETQQRAVEARLRTLAREKTLDEFAEEAAKIDADELPDRLKALEAAYQDLDQRRQQISTSIGQEQEKLQSLETSARLARADGAAAECEHLMSRLETEVDRYVHLRLAWAVLREAIEDFRQKHQAPVLQRAGAMFAKLTLGSFGDLRVDLNEKDQPVLMGIRPDGQSPVSIDGMSVGTVDQLFLALKLALLDHYLQSHPAMPLVLDDLLIQFDDERAAAALATLADLSCRTQVLFFTHHEHLADLARARLPEDRLFVHHLGDLRSA